MSSKELRVAVVGAGRWAERAHIPGWQRDPRVEVAAVVDSDADLDDAIPSTAWSIFYSAGQSCEARSRLLVEASVYDDVVARVTELAQRVGGLRVQWDHPFGVGLADWYS